MFCWRWVRRDMRVDGGFLIHEVVRQNTYRIALFYVGGIHAQAFGFSMELWVMWFRMISFSDAYLF